MRTGVGTGVGGDASCPSRALRLQPSAFQERGGARAQSKHAKGVPCILRLQRRSAAGRDWGMPPAQVAPPGARGPYPARPSPPPPRCSPLTGMLAAAHASARRAANKKVLLGAAPRGAGGRYMAAGVQQGEW